MVATESAAADRSWCLNILFSEGPDSAYGNPYHRLKGSFRA